MNSEPTFAERIRARYPEGLTGLFAIGGTRTTYILEHNRQKAAPGVIEDFQHYSDYLLDRYFDMCRMFLELGGHNMVITALGFQSFYERGEKYAEFISQATLALISDRAIAQYRSLGVDPYFIGIDTLLHMPSDTSAHHLGKTLTDFQRSWECDNSRPKIFWEIASIPLFTFRRADETLGKEISERTSLAVVEASTLIDLHDVLYRHYAQAAYGVQIPQAHFYLATNRNGDLKLRSILPIALTCGGDFRAYFTPYPTLFMTREAMQAMLDDLAFGEQRFRSKTMDHRDAYTPEIAEAEYQHFRALSADPTSILGLSRRGSTLSDDT